MNLITKINQILLVGLCGIIFSCSELFLTEIEILDCVENEIECSYSNHIQPIFDSNCNSCHEIAGDGNGNLSLSSYANTLSGGYNGSPIGNTLENSLLYKKIIGNPDTGSQMPPSELMDQKNIDIISKWILDGANE
jgi:hypothetical protein